MTAMVGGKVDSVDPGRCSHDLAPAITDLISVESHVGRTLSLNDRKKEKGIDLSILAMDGLSEREPVARLP